MYPVVDGMQHVRLRKTQQTGGCPAIRWWFRIDEAAEVIELLHAETLEAGNGEE